MSKSLDYWNEPVRSIWPIAPHVSNKTTKIENSINNLKDSLDILSEWLTFKENVQTRLYNIKLRKKMGPLAENMEFKYAMLNFKNELTIWMDENQTMWVKFMFDIQNTRNPPLFICTNTWYFSTFSKRASETPLKKSTK